MATAFHFDLGEPQKQLSCPHAQESLTLPLDREDLFWAELRTKKNQIMPSTAKKTKELSTLNHLTADSSEPQYIIHNYIPVYAPIL